jgi:hypothetical protein
MGADADSDEVAWAVRDDVARVRRLAGVSIFGGGRMLVKRTLGLGSVASVSAWRFDSEKVVEIEIDEACKALPVAVSCIPDLEGMRLGVLDDAKWNANRILRKTAAGQPGTAHGSRSRVSP